MLQPITIQHKAKHIFLLQVFHWQYKQVLTIRTSRQEPIHKQINLRPWAKSVSHTPSTPCSISSQIFQQVEKHLFCRANIEACLQTQPLNTPLNSINEQLLQ